MSQPSARRLALSRTKEPPEDSVRLRVVVGALVQLAVVAVVAQGALDAATAIGALVLVPAGYVFSYLRRDRPSVLVKIALAFGLLIALGVFMQRVRLATTVDEARMPLASLFIWVQALHAFDVPRRRDLAFSVVSSVILIADAASLSFTTAFIVLLLPWAVLAAVWLYATQRPPRLAPDRPRFVRRVASSGRRRPIAAARIAVGATSAVLSAVIVAFLVMPRLPGSFVRLPPFSLRDRSVDVSSFGGAVVNPSLPSAAGDGVVNFAPMAYPGFGQRVDLRARGRLSDRLVMLVRSPQAALWRGQVYDTFDGTGWTESDTSVMRVGESEDHSFTIPDEGDTTAGPAVGQHRIVTTFYVQTAQPNIVFSAYAPDRVYFPAAQLSIGAGSSIRSPILLDQGLVYSVVSEVPVTDPSVLRAANGPVAPDLEARYTQLPSDLPERDVRLAERITAGDTTTYARVLDVQHWLRTHTKYDLEVPPDPPGVDAVDEFLFERRRGFCEHIASAMAILLRSAGVPTRFVTGFGPGVRNPLTGYFEIRESDAHAWVEVLYPGVGWVPYDPTFGVPPADPGSAWFMAPRVLHAIGRWVANAVPRPLKAAAGVAGHGIAVAAAAAFGSWPVALAAAAAVAVALRRRRRRSRAQPTTSRAALAFDRLTRALERRGVARAAAQTPSEYLEAVRRRDPGDAVVRDAETIVRTFERDRFAAEPPDDDEVRLALAAADRVARAEA